MSAVTANPAAPTTNANSGPGGAPATTTGPTTGGPVTGAAAAAGATGPAAAGAGPAAAGAGGAGAHHAHAAGAGAGHAHGHAAGASAPMASPSLYVGDLQPDVTEALLFEIFSSAGPVASVRVCRDAATRRSLGYAYVNFHRVEDAEKALDTMNFSSIRGRPCRIMWSHRDPSLRKSGLGNIFVKGLAPSIDQKQLFDTFSVFGNILSCKVALDSKRQSLGYGFVHYESDESAASAIASANGMGLSGNTISVQQFKSKRERAGPDAKAKFTNCYVKNLPDDIANKDAFDALFAKYGEITSSFLAADEKGKSKGYGFVNFRTPEQASAAVEALNNRTMGSKVIFMGRAQKKEEREKELRESFEQKRAERAKKFAGVNLYVKNLADGIDSDRLAQEFKAYGAITSCKVMRDTAGKSKGFGFVCFSSPEEATRAVTDMNGHMVEGKPLYVALAQRKEVRRAQLEAQYAQRAQSQKMMGAGPGPMYGPPQGMPFYPVPPNMAGAPYFQHPMAGVPRGQGAPAMWRPGMVAMGVPAQHQHQQMRGPFPGAPGAPGAGPRPSGPGMGGMGGMGMGPGGRGGGRGMGMGPGGRGAGRGGRGGFMGGPGAAGMGMGARGGMPQRGPGGPGGMGMGPGVGVGVGPNAAGAPGASGAAGAAAGAGGPRVAYNQNARNQGPPMPSGAHPDAQAAHAAAMQQAQAVAMQQAAAAAAAAHHAVPGHGPHAAGVDDAAAGGAAADTLTADVLAKAPEEQRKQMIGERLFPLIAQKQPALAGKITGMLLEMDNGELLHLLESPSALDEKIAEALGVLENSEKQEQDGAKTDA